MGVPAKAGKGQITELLDRVQLGDSQALDELIPLIYQQLKAIARNQMRGERRSHTFSPTALVHEVFLKLKDGGEVAAQNRTHFFAIAARSMRWLLADYARAKKTLKRGGEGPVAVQFDENRHSVAAEIEPSALDEALSKLERQDPRLCRVVELRQLVGLTVEETAEALGTSTGTVKRDWVAAKAWLARELLSGESGDR